MPVCCDLYQHKQATNYEQILLNRNELQENVHFVIHCPTQAARMLATDYEVYQLIFNSKCQLLRIELNQIITEIWKYTVIHGEDALGVNIFDENEISNFSHDHVAKCHFAVFWCSHPTKTGSVFSKLTDFDPIPPSKDGTAYYIAPYRDFVVESTIKPEYKISFGIKQCSRRQCKQNAYCTCKTHKGATPPCPQLADNGTCQIWKTIREIDEGESKTVIQDKLKPRMLKHVCNYDHYEYFGKKQPVCKNDNKCIHYLNVLNDNSHDFKDKIHLYLYVHKPCVNEQIVMVDMDRSKRKTHGIFEYVPYHEVKDIHIKRSINPCFLYFSRSLRYQLFCLIREVIQNGFIQDLKPKSNNCNYVKKAIFASNINSNVDFIIFVCKKEFKIFDEVEEKMKHERYKHCQFDLSPVHILALLLYCNGNCNHSLCKSQLDGTFQTKWKYFDGFLNLAICALSVEEIHYENLYSGLCNVGFDINKLYLDGETRLLFKTNVSFTDDINVAKEFRGAEGMLLGLNMSRRDMLCYYNSQFWACDVSWLSKYPTEREVLIARGSIINITPLQSIQIENNQYILVHSDEDIADCFQKMFLM